MFAAHPAIPPRTLFKTANRECRYWHSDTATSRRVARAAIISIRDY